LFSVFLGFVFGHLIPPLKGLIGKGLGGITGDVMSGWLIQGIGFAGTALLLLLLMVSWGVFISPKFMPWLGNLFRVKKKSEVEKKKATAVEPPTPPVPTDVIIEIPDNGGDNGFVVRRPEEAPEEPIAEDPPVVVIPPETNDDAEINNFFAGGSELYDPTKELSHYKKPTVDLLEDHKGKGAMPTDEELERNKNKIVTVLQNFNIGIDKIIATIGPTVTLYEIIPKAGVRIASIKRLEDDIALNLAALGIRIIAPIPGKGTVGIEVPNEHPNTVSMLSVIKSQKFQEAQYDLPVALGKKIDNEIYTFDLAKMPHLLVAGATGQGKSVGLNAIITSLLYRKHPSELKLVLVDPKRVELTLYSKLERHFLAKLPDTEEAIITDTQKVVYTLKSLCIEMDERYQLLQLAQVRNIKEYNERFVNRRLNPLKGHRYMPFIVVIIDEFADLIMTAGREVEEPIARLAQLARAIGIHLVIATQRPTVNIITGLIKANFPARIAFRVISGVDARTILDTTGANQLIGRGDMLVSTGNEMIRVQCAFIDTPEVERICSFIGQQQGFGEAFPLPEYKGEEGNNNAGKVDLGKRDELFDEAARIMVQSQQGSTSLIQRKLNLGYNRAGRLMDQLEAAGIVGPPEGSKARQVLISDFITLDAKLAALNNE
jgi:S-DNA-T family DNA segregation ATPase FtsK/SpoIIIE